MSKTFELTIRDGAKVIHTASANVDDDFEHELFDAYLTYYPDATDDGVLFLRIVRGMFEGIMNNIAVAKAQRLQRPEVPPPRFTIVGEEVRELPELQARVLAGELSPDAAAIEAGVRTPPEPPSQEDANA